MFERRGPDYEAPPELRQYPAEDLWASGEPVPQLRSPGLRGPGVMFRNLPDAPTGHGAVINMVDPAEVAAHASARANREGQLAARGIKKPAREELATLRAEYLGDNPRPMTNREALAQNRAEKKLAFPSFVAESRDRPVTQVEKLWHLGTESATRSAIGRNIPAATTALQREQELLGLLRAAETAADRPTALRHYAALLSGAYGISAGKLEPVMAALLIEGLRNAPAMGAAAISADRLGQLLRLPAVQRSAILSRLMSSHEDTAR